MPLAFGTSPREAMLCQFGRDLRTSTLDWLASITSEPRLDAFHIGESEIEEDAVEPAAQGEVRPRAQGQPEVATDLLPPPREPC